MNHLKKPSRREFLANMSYSLGLISAGHIFSQKIFAQSVNPIQRVIHVYYPHGILSKGDLMRGNFVINNQSPLKSLVPIAGDCRFIRNVSKKYKALRQKGSHSVCQSSALTGCATKKTHGAGSDLGNNTGAFGGKSVDIVAGEFLQKKYKTKEPYLVLGISDQHGDGNSGSSPYLWETVSWTGNKKPLLPTLRPSKVFADLQKHKQSLVSCGVSGVNPDEIKNKIKLLDKDIGKYNLIRENLKNYYSTNLMPKVEMEKLEQQIVRDIASKNQQKVDFQATLDGTATQNNNQDACVDLKNPGNQFDRVPGLSTFINGDRSQDRGFNAKAAAHMDLMMYALQSNYTRSITLNLGGRIYKDAHGAGHLSRDVGSRDHCFNLSFAYGVMIANVVKTLVDKLKAANLYDSTLIVFTGEFGNQKTDAHYNLHSPWMVINSGKNGEYNNGDVHIGDINVSTMNRIGDTSVKNFGSSDSALNREGRFNPNIF